MQATALNDLRGGNATRWSNIAEAASLSRTKSAELADLVGDLLPTDEGSLVVFGSLARSEYTPDSDLDWAILIDGQADSLHSKIVQSLRNKLDEAGFKVPGPTEIFGGLVFSHDVVHAIGGEEDTNRNTTRRLLLVLESKAIGGELSAAAHGRILNAVLNRYILEDGSFIASNRRKDRIPRFLLNDVIRFWRTMAVDYANKYRSRSGDKWALRNIKLRMSRKLLFVSGLLMCVSWALRESETTDDELVVPKLVTHLHTWTKRPPLESLAVIVKQYAPELASNIFDCYDAFLAMLADNERRLRLERLSPDQAYEDDLFLEARRIATTFDAALTTLLFESDDGLSRLVKKYGVF